MLTEFTDSAGTFAFDPISPGAYDLTINKTLFYVVGESLPMGVDYDLEPATDSVSIEDDIQRDYTLPFRTRYLVSYDCTTSTAAPVQTNLKIKNTFLQALDDNTVLARELGSTDVIRVDLSSGTRTTVVNGAEIPCPLYSVAETPDGFYYACSDDSSILHVWSFGLDGVVQERAQQALSRDVTPDGYQVAYDGQRILIGVLDLSSMMGIPVTDYWAIFSYEPSTEELKEYLDDSLAPEDWVLGFPSLFGNRGSDVYAAAIGSPEEVDSSWSVYRVTDTGYSEHWSNSGGTIVGVLTGIAAVADKFFVLNADNTLFRIGDADVEEYTLAEGATYRALAARSADEVLLIAE